MSNPNVLAGRYASAEMKQLWSPEHKVVLERRLWIAVLRAQQELGVDVPDGVIAAAGMAAHLAGVCASKTTLPVIGIPVASGALNGEDALHSTVMMPPGMPVATVAINGAKNAALLAIQILSIEDASLAAKLDEDRATWEPKQLA